MGFKRVALIWGTLYVRAAADAFRRRCCSINHGVKGGRDAVLMAPVCGRGEPF